MGKRRLAEAHRRVVEPRKKSSIIVNYSYSGGSLTITLKDGKTVEYHNVPLSVYQGLAAASSAGQYWNEQIRGKPEYSAVRE